jgi:hypothetical protein
MTGMTLPSALSRPVAVSIGVTAWAIACWLRGRMRHLSEPSFQPELTIFATEEREMTVLDAGHRAHVHLELVHQRRPRHGRRSRWGRTRR